MITLRDCGVTAAGAGGGRWPPRTGAAAGGPMGARLGSLPPTPELLAQVAALPPATDQPDVDEDEARAADPQFSLRRLLRPVALAADGRRSA